MVFMQKAMVGTGGTGAPAPAGLERPTHRWLQRCRQRGCVWCQARHQAVASEGCFGSTGKRLLMKY